jgi:6-pyruvoyl-tetrahydropterin synthase
VSINGIFPWLCVLISAVMAKATLPYSLGVRDSLMIAHSFHGNSNFGPAGGMHGATYTCDVEFSTPSLNKETNWVIDIGRAESIVADVLAEYNLKNLDEVFPNGELTTTEFMAHKIYEGIRDRLRTDCNFAGEVSVKLWESHKAWATFTGKV